MKSMANKEIKISAIYRSPEVEIISVSEKDVISTSGPQDENQGDWDPQKRVNSILPEFNTDHG